MGDEKLSRILKETLGIIYLENIIRICDITYFKCIYFHQEIFHYFIISNEILWSDIIRYYFQNE